MTTVRFPPRPPGGVLGLDLARKTGFSYAVADGEQAGGTWVLPSLSVPGEQAVAFEHVLWQAIEAFKPKFVFAEAGIMIGGQQGTANMKTAFGLWAMAAAVCYRAEVQFRELTPQEARLKVLRDGRPPNPKSVVMQWCQARGFTFWDDNEADAIIVREAGLIQIFGQGAKAPNGPWDQRRFWREGEML